jgi:phosphoenolpyruvate-protein kinase (PTS system EI component)
MTKSEGEVEVVPPNEPTADVVDRRAKLKKEIDRLEKALEASNESLREGKAKMADENEIRQRLSAHDELLRQWHAVLKANAEL